MVFSYLKKRDFWTEVGGTEGYITAVRQLGSDYHQLNNKATGYTISDSVWGRLADLTRINKKNILDNRKWLFTTWNEDRRKVRTMFMSTQVDDLLPSNTNQLSHNDDVADALHMTTMSHNPSLLTIPSVEPRVTRSKDVSSPHHVYHFTMSYDEWRKFCNRKLCEVYPDWGDHLAAHLYQLKITCTIIFRYHHIRKKDSRKNNCSLFSAKGYCKLEHCPVVIEIEVDDGPRDKYSASVFKVTVVGDANHDPKLEKAARPLTGAAREAAAKQVVQVGALGVFEKNIRFADEDLLRAGNFSQVPSMDVLKTAKQQYNKKYRLDEDYFKELRMFGFLTRFIDHNSKDVKGYIQTNGEWPFTTHFFTEIQLNRFAKYCKREKYSCLHIDATGSVVRKLQHQKDVFFYCMVFQDKNSSIMPLSGALLTDHTAVSITSYFNCLRSKLAMRSKVARPTFVVIDFSSALINSVLASFNVENINTYLRRCYNTIGRVYNTKQLRNMTFLRLCCAHAMKAFSRSLFKLNVGKNNHRHLMSLFAVLLNSTDLDGIFDLYSRIIDIYGDPYCDRSCNELALLLSRSNSSEFDVTPYLEEKHVEDDKDHQQDFLEETDITTDPIIHQSPFNVKACDRIPALRSIIENKTLDKEPCNSLYSPKVIRTLHKWFAYIPLWSCLLTDFFERYAKDAKRVSTDDWKFGYGRLSNALIESYFHTTKSSILESRTNLRPTDFLIRMYNHTLSRFKADQFDVRQSSRGRKKKGGQSDDLNAEDKWGRPGRNNGKTNRRIGHFNDQISESNACKLAKGKKQKKMLSFDDSSCSSIKTPSPTSITPPTPSPINGSPTSLSSMNSPIIMPSTNPFTCFDDVESTSANNSITNSSYGFCVQSPNVHRIAKKIICDTEVISPLVTASVSPVPSSDSSVNMFSALTASDSISDLENIYNNKIERRDAQRRAMESTDMNIFACFADSANLSRALSPKRAHVTSDSSTSVSKEEMLKTLRQKKLKTSLANSTIKQNYTLRKDYRTTKIGNLTFTWPPFGIENTIYRNQTFSVINTCPIDTGLFVLYHAYKTGTDAFRNIFESDTLDAHTFLRRTFQLIETDGWTIARLHWLTERNLFTTKTRYGQYDIKNTMDEIVFRFTKPMQTFLLKSRCTCTACPKLEREIMSTYIALGFDGNKPLNYISSFANVHEGTCGANLGPNEPLDYPADYLLDEHYPVINLETNASSVEERYVCQAVRITDATRFVYKVPFVVVTVENICTFMTQLPDPLYIGEYQYYLSAGIINHQEHFTALIKSNNNIYYLFDDTKSLGCHIDYGHRKIEFALYVLKL